MATSVEELMLLERVFLRLGSAETDEQLENILGKFLVPIILKLSTSHQDVHKKVMELLMHINKRIKTRPLVQLPVEPLLIQYHDAASSSFVTNFALIYIKLGYPRLPVAKQIELVPNLVDALHGKPVAHLEGLLLLLVSLLGKIKFSNNESIKLKPLFALAEKPDVSKHFLEILLDVLLLPYSSLNSQENIVPPGMSRTSFGRLTQNAPIKPEELEPIKIGILKLFSYDIFKPADVLIHLVVAASDTRFEVTNLAEMELKKLVGLIDWESPHTSQPLFILFLGAKSAKEEQKKIAADTRIRLKVMAYLCRMKGSACLFPFSLQIVFDSLYGENTNNRLKTMALDFTGNLIRYAAGDSLEKVSPVLLAGLVKFIKNEENEQTLAYVIIAMLAQKFPRIAFNDISLLELFFTKLETASPGMKLQIREGLLNLILAYKYDIFPDEANKNDRLGILLAFVKVKLTSEDVMVRFASVKTLSTIFPPEDVPSKFLLLTAVGDAEDDIHKEAFKALYGTIRKNDFDLSDKIEKTFLPSFDQITKYVYDEATANMKDKTKVITIGSKLLPFKAMVYLEILLYLRLCLLKSLDIPLTRDVIRHPSEYTPKVVKTLQAVYHKDDENKEILMQYFSMVKELLLVQPDSQSLSCIIEIIGSVPELYSLIENDLNWIKGQLSNVKEDIREYSSVLYALVLPEDKFDSAINDLLDQTTKNNFEAQHGSLLAIGTCFEAYALKKKRANSSFDKNALVEECLNALFTFLKHKNPLLISASVTSVGLIGRVIRLPLDPGETSIKDGSPNAKKQAVAINQLQLVDVLFDIINDTKLSTKVKEKAVRCLGLLCVGEKFPHIKVVMKGLLATARETKDIEVHFTVGESLLMCCQNVGSPEARDAWNVSRDEFKTSSEIDDNFEWFLEELINLTKQSHPNSKQASCIWLLLILKGCGKREAVTGKLQVLQSTFMDLLSESNDFIQDVAAKGLCVLYDLFRTENLMVALVNQLALGPRTAIVDPKSTEGSDVKSTYTGENLTTYRELCFLASALNRPDLIYQFLHLAHHSAIWNSKKGAVFGFSSTAEKCRDDLKQYVSEIVPKLFKYQFDPVPCIKTSMSNIWHVLVSENQSTLDKYYHEILKDLLEHLNSSQYRVRQACCLALQDFLRGSSTRSIHDAVDYMDELWNKLFRVMDDHHEATRLVASRTTKMLSKLCIKGSNLDQGKNGTKMIEAILPVLLNTGMIHPVSEIRNLSLDTISELINSAGNQVKSFLPRLIPALLQATGEFESTQLAYLSTMMGSRTEAQEAIDSVRASRAKSHDSTEAVAKSLRYADATILPELVPNILDLMKPSIALGTRIACAHFITLLVLELGIDVQPFSRKFLKALLNGLTDRNSAVRKHNAAAIGQLVGVCEPATLEKLFLKLRAWYFEREEDSIRFAIASTIQSIGIHHQDIVKQYSKSVLPLVFFAMHSEKSPETQRTLDLWTEVWSEHSPGTESGIQQNIEPIINMLKEGLESSSWSVKAQAANAVDTVASKLGASMDSQHTKALLSILLNGLSGKTWKGKETLLKALCSICSNCTSYLKSNEDVSINAIVDSVCREAKKQEIVYKTAALECLGEVLSSLSVDGFLEVSEIVADIFNGKGKEEQEGGKENEGKELDLKIAAYETLGKAWPENHPDTQIKYGDYFIDHCVQALPNVTKTIQVSILSALYNFTNKHYLLKKTDFNETEKTSLNKVVNKLLETLTYSLGIAKHTKLRIEALNILFCLASKLKQNNIEVELGAVKSMFSGVLPVLATDNQPEIKCRLNDIKDILY